MDDLIASTGVAYRALANPSFMDNLLRQVRSIRDQGVFTDTVAAGRQGRGRHPRHRRGRRPAAAGPLVERRGASRCSARTTCRRTTWPAS